MNRFLNRRRHKLADFVNDYRKKTDIIHYQTENHTLPDLQVIPNTTNSRINTHLVARRCMIDETNKHGCARDERSSSCVLSQKRKYDPSTFGCGLGWVEAVSIDSTDTVGVRG